MKTKRKKASNENLGLIRRVSGIEREMHLYRELRKADRDKLDGINGWSADLEKRLIRIENVVEKIQAQGASLSIVAELRAQLTDSLVAYKAESRESDDRIEYLVLTLDKIVEDFKKELLDYLTGKRLREAELEADGRLKVELSHQPLKLIAENNRTIPGLELKETQMCAGTGELGRETHGQ